MDQVLTVNLLPSFHVQNNQIWLSFRMPPSMCLYGNRFRILAQSRLNHFHIFFPNTVNINLVRRCQLSLFPPSLFSNFLTSGFRELCWIWLVDTFERSSVWNVLWWRTYTTLGKSTGEESFIDVNEGIFPETFEHFYLKPQRMKVQ